MKIRLAVGDEDYDKIAEYLIAHGIEIDDEAEFVLTQKGKYASHIAARDPGTGERLHISTGEIIYIESYGHTVEVHTGSGVFETSDRLYQLMALLDPDKFIRVSNSVIISKRRVKRINPALSMKFTLIMSDGAKVDVTRSYYNAFKDAFNI